MKHVVEIIRYKTLAQIEALNAEELVAYKKLMLSQMEALRAAAMDWNQTYKRVMHQIHGVALALEAELEMAELDRMESDSSDYGQIGYIH